jgi:maltose 6'-phosphate phosphatase
MVDRNRTYRIPRIATLLALSQLLFASPTNADDQASATDLSILTLNLHTYQELRNPDAQDYELTDELARQRIDAYGAVFDRIAAGIAQLDPDIICLQEVGEWPGGTQNNTGTIEFGATDTNMVHQILSRLGDKRYFYTMDWSHYGWDVWLEGSAILSKYPISSTDSRFISDPDNGRYEFWKTRNVPMARFEVPGIGHIAVFSVHAGWWDDPEEPAQEQYLRLFDWTQEMTGPLDTTILCGDFNAPAGGAAYQYLTSVMNFSDQYLLANPDGMHDATVGGGADGWQESDSGERIDYIFVNSDSPLAAKHARRVFTQAQLGRVSDHVGVFAEFNVRQSAD